MADAPTYPPLPPKRELGMGLMYEPVEGFNADDMRAFVDADRAARAAQPQPSQPLTDAQVGDLCGEANRGYCIESEHYFKAFRDAEEAHGITGQATPPSPPVAAPPATPEPFAFVQEMWDELARQGHSEHDMRRWSKALTALESAQPQPQPAQPLTGARPERCPSCRNGDLYSCTCPFPTSRNAGPPHPDTAQPLTADQRQDLLAAAFYIACRDETGATLKDVDAERIADLLTELSGFDLDSITAPSTPTPEVAP